MPQPSTAQSLATAEQAVVHGLAPDEWDRIVDRLGRTPNELELGLFSVMWSEHCSYKSSRLHLAKLPTTGACVIHGPGENAGVIDIGDGQAAIFKMESHNHPSFIEPYQGAATGVGGILRDVFTMGARPVANLNALRFGSIIHPKTPHLLSGVVAGIGGYGNCVGVPTVGGEVGFHPAYDGNILVNAMTVGVADQDKIFLSAAAGVGNPVVYVGSKTGRDGIHGATMASAEFGEDSEEKRPTVQVGDPFTEKLLIEACLELMASDAIVAIQDMGAAGLTSSSIEMASKGGVGLELDMDAVPCREEGMTPYEMMLSESQERMLMVLRPGREDMARAIFDKWELDFAVIGRVTDTGCMVLTWGGETVCDLPIGPLADEAPKYDRPHVRTPPPEPLTDVPESTDIGADLLKLMASPELCSRRWVWEQYDRQVGGDTVQTGGDAAVVRIHGTDKALAITTDCTPRYCQADPYEGGKQAIAEAYRNLCAVGATPLAATDCLNFGNPERPEIMGQLVGCIEGMAAACEALGLPIVSGNVSLYNETKGADGRAQAILPTPAIGAVGLVEDWRRAATIGFKAEGEQLWLVGPQGEHLGQSLWLREIAERADGLPPAMNLEEERRSGEFVRGVVADGLVTAVHDVADGGVLVAVAEMALAGGLGVDLQPRWVGTLQGTSTFITDEEATRAKLVPHFFGEDQGRYLFTTHEAEPNDLLQRCKECGVPIAWLGYVGGDAICIGDCGGGLTFADIPLADLRAAHEGTLPRLMEGEIVA